jgi:hypothetical protein
MRLADWQEGVENGEAGLGISPTDRPAAALDQMGEMRSRVRQSDPWQRSAEGEREQLQAELQALGFLSCM